MKMFLEGQCLGNIITGQQQHGYGWVWWFVFSMPATAQYLLASLVACMLRALFGTFYTGISIASCAWLMWLLINCHYYPNNDV